MIKIVVLAATIGATTTTPVEPIPMRTMVSVKVMALVKVRERVKVRVKVKVKGREATQEREEAPMVLVKSAHPMMTAPHIPTPNIAN